MYQIIYYIPHNAPVKYNFLFNSLWGAIFKARAIFEEHGINTDVINTETGEILAIFSMKEIWVDADLEVDLQILATKVLE